VEIPRLFSLIAICTLVGGPATGATLQAVTTKNLSLRSGPATTSPRITVVKSGVQVTLLEPQPKGDYYHVRAAQQEGWLWAAGVQVTPTSGVSSRKLVRRPADMEQEPQFHVSAAGACQADLSSCPDTGCASPGTPHAIVNQRKRRMPTATSAVLLTFDDFATLQQQADSLVGENKELSADQRAQLTALNVGAGKVSEGDLVTLTGYLVGTPHPNTGESVNCNLKGESNNDFHIPLSNDPGNTDFQGIVVEMIPQSRNSSWTLGKLTQIENNGQLVLVSGALFYDNLHLVNGDAANPRKGQPHRFSLWEIHPIAQVGVCTKSANSCDPNRPSDWASLGSGP
jgi:hypothetical protein